MSLYDYGLGTLAQYELTADRSARTRGALLCYTAQGLLILREFHGSEKKLEKQQELLMKLQENGINTDYFLRNNQESLVSAVTIPPIDVTLNTPAAKIAINLILLFFIISKLPSFFTVMIFILLLSQADKNIHFSTCS